MTQEQKAPKYEYRGQGFKNKREYNNAIAISFLSDEGKNVLITLMDNAAKRVMEKLDKTYEEAAKMLHIGYRNTLEKTLNQDLKATADSLTVPGYVELNIFCYGPGGSVLSNGSQILIRKHFNEEGLEILGDKILEDVENAHVKKEETPRVDEDKIYEGRDNPVLEYKSNDSPVKLSISDDIDAEDNIGENSPAFEDYLNGKDRKGFM